MNNLTDIRPMFNSDTKRVLFLVGKLCVGGSEKKAISLANRLAKKGYQTAFAFFTGEKSLAKSLERNVTLFSAEQSRKLDLKAMIRYRNFVLGQSFNCVISMGLYASFLHKSCLVFANHSPKEFVSLNMSVPSPKVRQKLFIYKAITKKTYVIFGAAHQRKIWSEEYGFTPETSGVIYNGVDTSYFDRHQCDGRKALRLIHNISNDDIVLGVVAALRPEKAVGDLISVASQLRQHGYPVKVLVAGDGVLMPHLKQLVQKNNFTDHAIFLGQQTDVRPALCAMDIFVLPSVAVETFSNAALEAMAMELPVVLSDIGGAREMITEGVNGAVYPPGNVFVLKQTIETMILEGKLRAMGRASRKLATNKFTMDLMLTSYRRLIEAS